ncbi:MAG TPA: T9SS type A sorting domain-containing protein [Salinivirga sp.]|uniref:T9SS type A sorting domain-containing protein n=1 Tax=Salinivirga sp. TaxID=1970192 RepID=UPI002B481747|nr:T9SS type A sorting domain-containing protein [Salinivirga sp.]HKK58758.1 T9SS type A sorting domain-containing protein [Salinivirga sp.]
MKKLSPFKMFKKTYRPLIMFWFSIVWLFCATSLNAQGPEWITTIGGTASDYIKAIQQDENGNLYACGYFSGTVDFNPHETETDEYTSSGASAGFIAKYASDGTYLWTTILDGTQHNWILDLTIIDGNNAGVYVAGAYSDQIDFDPGSSSVSYIAEDSYDAFVAGYNLETGALIQEYVYAGTESEFATSITSYGNNNIVVAGTFRGQIDFNFYKDEKVIFTSNGESDFFIRNFSPAGGAFWSRRIGGTGNDLLDHRTLEVDAAYNIYLGGSFQNVVDFDPDNTNTYEMTSEGGKDAFLLALNSDAQFQWAKQTGNANDESTTALTIDSTGIYSAISFTGTISCIVGYAGGMPVFEDFTSYGGQDILLTKHTMGGQIIGDSFGHIGGDLEDQCNDLMTDNDGHVFATGYFMSSDFDLNPQEETQIFGSSGGKDIFMAGYSSSYDYEWANKYGGNEDDEGINLLYDSREIYCAGTFRNTVNFDISTETSNGQEDLFLLATSIWNTETEILDFEIPQSIAPAIIDGEASTIDIVVGNGVDITSLTPTITLSLGASVDPPSGVAQDFTDPKIYTVLAENGSDVQHWTVTVTEDPNNETEILTFELTESTGPADIDPVAGTVDIEVAYGTDLTTLTPTITLSPGASIDPESGIAQDFTNSVDYTVTAENGTDTQIWTVAVTEAVSISELPQADFSLYPNPVSHSLNFSGDGIIQQVKIYNLQGKLLETKIFNSGKGGINMQNYTAGNYVLKLQGKNGKVYVHLITVSR